jgi:LysM repeat protein
MLSYNSKAAATLVALAHLAAVVAAAGACTRQYKVVDGDTCDRISAAQNVSTFQLAAVNPEIDAGCSNLAIDQVLCLGTEGEDCTTTYVVKPLDTCDGISQFAGINNTILYANNPNIDSECTNIYIGEVLCTAGAVNVPSNSGPFAPPAPPPPAGVDSAPPANAAPPPPPAPPSAPAPGGGDNGDNGGDNGGDEPFCDELTPRDLEEYEWYY